MALSFQNAVDKGSQLYLDGLPIGHPIKLTILNQGCELFVGGNLFDEQFLVAILMKSEFGIPLELLKKFIKTTTQKSILIPRD